MIYEHLKNHYKKVFPEVLTLGPIELIGERIKINISPGSVLGHPSKQFIEQFTSANNTTKQELLNNRLSVIISEGVIIGPYSNIYEGVRLENDVFLEGRCIIRNETAIGKCTRVYFGAYIGNKVTIGTNCKIGGFIGNRAVVGDESAILGSLVHEYPCPNLKKKEPSPVVGNNVLVGMNALIIGGIKIGNNAKIAAGTTVLKDVAENSLVTGVWK